MFFVDCVSAARLLKICAFKTSIQWQNLSLARRFKCESQEYSSADTKKCNKNRSSKDLKKLEKTVRFLRHQYVAANYQVKEQTKVAQTYK